MTTSGSYGDSSPDSRIPKVSVVTITYNHEKYIRDALDGFIGQQTDFPVEFIVADDASTDATPAIVSGYAERYPDLIRPILRPQNVGGHYNFYGALAASRGEYIALCEGDDYWTDPLKLAKQAAVLDAHPEISVCFHPVRVQLEDGSFEAEEFPPLNWRDDISLNALLTRNFIQTNSVMYRKLPSYDGVDPEMMPGDHYFHVRHAASGNIAMLPEAMAVYRRHAQGLWANRFSDPALFWSKMGVGHAAMYEAMLELFPGDPIRRQMISWSADWILRDIANTAGEQVLLSVIEGHPKFALLALEHRWRSA